MGDRAFAPIEFAASVAALVMVLLACADLTFYLRDKMRLDRVASGVGLLVSGYTELYRNDFDGLWQAARTMANDPLKPDSSLKVEGAAGATILTGIVNSDGKPVIAWQRQTAGSSFTSAFGKEKAAPANLPDSYVVPVGASVIAVEVYTTVSPWVLSKTMMGTSGDPTLRSYALFQPRAALLGQIITDKDRP